MYVCVCLLLEIYVDLQLHICSKRIFFNCTQAQIKPLSQVFVGHSQGCPGLKRE